MTTTIVAYASFGPDPFLGATSSADILLLVGTSTPQSLAHHRFRFLDGQAPRPGAHGIVELELEDHPPSMSGPLPIWAGAIVGHVWGLRVCSPDHSPPARPPNLLHRRDRRLGSSAPINDLCHSPSTWSALSAHEPDASSSRAHEPSS